MKVMRYKFKVGQSVSFAAGKLTLAGAAGDYEIIRLVPSDDGKPRYRIRSLAEPFERVATEAELALGG